MAKCNKLIDAEAAVSVAMAALVDTFIERKWTDADDYRFKATIAMARALDALPDASEGFFDYVAKESHRTGKSPQEVFAAEWKAHVKLKDDSLWPDVSEGGAE